MQASQQNERAKTFTNEYLDKIFFSLFSTCANHSKFFNCKVTGVTQVTFCKWSLSGGVGRTLRVNSFTFLASS